jgi:hypothetical protein
MGAKVREQEVKSTKKSQEDRVAEEFAMRIINVQQLPTYYDNARNMYQGNIDLAREQGFYNKEVIAAEDGYIEMYYRNCATFLEVANAFASAPIPDSVALVQYYIEGEGYVKEDAEMQVNMDLDAYREELQTKSETARTAALPQCATGLQAAAHYGIEDQWTDSLYATVKSINDTSAALQIKITKFDPSTLFRDPIYLKTKTRLEQIAGTSDEVISKQEKIKAYREIIKDGQDLQAKLKAELADLKAKIKAADDAKKAAAAKAEAAVQKATQK